jgi:hypothetical protein
MRGLSPKIISGGFSAKQEYRNTTHISIQYHMKFKLKLLQIKCHVLELQEVKLQRILQMISQSLSGSKHFLRKRTTPRHKSNHLTLEVKTFFNTLHQRWIPARIPALKHGLPIDCCQQHHRKRERETCTQH